MPKYHPDYFAAQAALRAIFGNILRGKYTSRDSFIAAMQAWVSHYEKPSQAAQVHVSDIIKLAGNFCAYK